MTKIKLCGLKRECDIAYANELLPDYIGFVFAEGSSRYVEPQRAKVLKEQLKKQIISVGVFVNEKTEVIADLIRQNIIQVVQLHGTEDSAYIQALRTYVNCPVIQAFQIGSMKDIETANASIADYILLDSGGGSGETFDWSLLKEMKCPYFLAGGLNSDNVKKAVRELQPYAVDVSSSLETQGSKDIQKMRTFVNAVRSI